ncbi:polyribonucleotide nucleotidyltransferase [Patescibacteria group bacterium]|nr:polyribonucleotide nucleotidyltransferase [Patescibacteria group bacterium]
MEKMTSMQFAGKELTLRTGKLATMAGGSCEIQWGDNIVLVTACMSGARDGIDYFPLSVDFQEKFYAAGKIKGSKFIKREGRPSDNAILTSRLIDRPIRPMFPKGIKNEVQIICTVLSTEAECDLGTFAIIGASLALKLSGMPFEGPCASVRVGYDNGEYILNPTYEQIEKGSLDLVIAGTSEAVTMVEAGAKELAEDIVLDAFDFAHKHIKEICDLQNQLLSQLEITALDYEVFKLSEGVEQAIDQEVTDAIVDEFYGLDKVGFYSKWDELSSSLEEKFADKLESGEWLKVDIANSMKDAFKKKMRNNVLNGDRRLDNRKLDEVRNVHCDVGILPRTHGSGLFNRGETQILTTTTLGGPQDQMVVDEMSMDYKKRFMHHYYFPPYATGEVKFLRGVGRREIGHGFLAERALAPVIPSEADFPYTLYLVSETMSCNGSSSMGSVCGSTLSLMDAGVPIKSPVTGIAMGLISSEEKGEYKVLSDIQAQEDFLGDLDFKVAGSENGLTALQMDTKLKGLSIDLLKTVMKQAGSGRAYILEEMLKAISKPRENLSKYAPLLMSLKVDPDMIGAIIGKGGETIQKITADFGVEIDINDDGVVTITADNQESGNLAAERIKQIAYVPVVGEIVEGKVVKILEFGALVEIGPDKVGMVHISELANERVGKVEDVVKEGDIFKVKILSAEANGRIALSRKACLDK